MFRRRKTPVLLLKDQGLVKTIKFDKKNSKYVGDPINAVKIFNDFQADELIFLDIEATLQKRTISLDIVKNIIDKNNELFASNKVKFEVADICMDKIPPCDLIMIRDCMFHLSYYDINKLLNNLERTEYKYLLTTTHSTENNFINKDIITGDFRLIDLFSKPLNFNEQLVIEKIRDYPHGYPIKRDMILKKLVKYKKENNKFVL